MSENLYVITGSTGHVGATLTRKLLNAKKQIRVVARHADRLREFAQKGAQAAAGSVEDAEFLKKAFEGAQIAFLMLPPLPATQNLRADQNRISNAYAQAVKASRIQNVVLLSSVGAHLSHGTGPVLGLHDLELRFGEFRELNVLNLRPTFFMENLLNGIPVIKGMGVYGSSLKPDLPLGMIASSDIGDIAARKLLELDFKGNQTLELLGAKETTMAEVVTVLGHAIGKPDLKYVQFPYEDEKKGMMGAGLSEDFARSLIEMTRGFNEGLVKPTQTRSAETTTPTTLETFAQTIFAPAFKG